MCSIQQICCMIHSSAQRSYSPTYEYYLLSKLYISYSGKNSIGLSVNLSEYKGLGSPGRVMKKKNLLYKISFKGMLQFSNWKEFLHIIHNLVIVIYTYLGLPRASKEL